MMDAHMPIGLDEDTRRQLTRIEAMLNAICDNKGIIPETLPGYDRRRSPSPSSRSPSSSGASMERLHLSQVPALPLQTAGMHLSLYPHIYCTSDIIQPVPSQRKRRLLQRKVQWSHKLYQLAWIILGQGIRCTSVSFVNQYHPHSLGIGEVWLCLR